MAYMFKGWEDLTLLDITNFNVSNVNKMKSFNRIIYGGLIKISESFNYTVPRGLSHRTSRTFSPEPHGLSHQNLTAFYAEPRGVS